MRLLLTGASGFVGAAVARLAHARGHSVHGPLRPGATPPAPGEWREVADLAGPVDFASLLEGADAVIHCAALAHARPRPSERARVMAVNAELPVRLAEAARKAGVKRFVFVSSVKAVGDASGAAPWTEAQPCAPSTAYGEAKLDAERALSRLAGIEVVIVRPPLVVAPESKANAGLLLRLAASPWPLPLALAGAPRSLVGRESLTRALLAAAGGGPAGVYFWADAPALSTAEMVAALRDGLGRPAGLFPAPLPPLGPLKTLLSPLEVDPSAFARAFQITPGDSRALLRATARAAMTARVGKNS